MSEREEQSSQPAPSGAKPGWPPEEGEYRFGYDRGGVPGFLVLIYVAFLTMVFFYVVDHLVPAWGSLSQHINP